MRYEQNDKVRPALHTLLSVDYAVCRGALVNMGSRGGIGTTWVVSFCCTNSIRPAMHLSKAAPHKPRVQLRGAESDHIPSGRGGSFGTLMGAGAAGRSPKIVFIR